MTGVRTKDMIVAPIPVLMYHVVDVARSDGEKRLCCRPDEFDRQMTYLAESGWQVVSLSNLLEAAAGGRSLPAKTAVLTFDDGTACTFERALPVLRRFGFPATVFVVAGLVGGRNEWMCREGHPERALLSIAQLRALGSEGIEVGSHSISHVRLAGLPAVELAREVVGSKTRLEGILGQPVRHFAYPYGSLDRAAVDAVHAAGYVSACSTVMGRNSASRFDRFALHRTEIKGDDALWQFRLKLVSGTHDMPPWSMPRAALKKLLVRTGFIPEVSAS